MVFTTKTLRILTTKNTKVTKKILDTNRRSSYIPANDISKDVLDCAFHVYKKIFCSIDELHEVVWDKNGIID